MKTARIDGFDWDDGNREKCLKHGLTLALIESVSLGGVHMMPDPAHSNREARYIAIGCTREQRHVFIAFTLRDRNGLRLLRPISARYMHRKEVEHYAKSTAEAGNGRRG